MPKDRTRTKPRTITIDEFDRDLPRVLAAARKAGGVLVVEQGGQPSFPRQHPAHCAARIAPVVMSADDHLRHWLAEGMTGCQFAKLIAQDKDRLVRVTFAGLALEDDVSRVFELGARAGLPAIAIFTRIRTEAGLVDQLKLLAAGNR